MILDSITAVAVLGTAKKSLTEEQKDWCASFKISVDNSEQALLQAAYIDSEMNLVGAVLESEEMGNSIERINPVENEIDDAFVIYIETMLNEFPQLAQYYIHLAFDQNKVLPKRFIPNYLDYIRTWEVALRYQASLIAGERAMYLAQFTKRWNFLLPTKINWETAFHKQRVTYAQQLRKTDPEKALEHIKTGYKENHSTERQELLKILAVNLSENDIVFLRENLSDKSKPVRQTAYALCAMVDTEIQEELKQQAGLWVKIRKGGFLKKSKLEVVLPEPSEWLEKLLTAERAGVKVGKKAEKLLNLVSLLPFSFYTETPKEVLDMLAKSEWNTVLLRGIQNAAILHKNTVWSMVLIDYLQASELRVDAKMLRLLTEEEFNETLKNQLNSHKDKFRYNEFLGVLLRDSNQAINLKNSKTVLEQLAKYYKDNQSETKKLYSEDTKIIKSVLARVDWSITALPAELDDFNDLFLTKQKLKESLK